MKAIYAELYKRINLTLIEHRQQTNPKYNLIFNQPNPSET